MTSFGHRILALVFAVALLGGAAQAQVPETQVNVSGNGRTPPPVLDPTENVKALVILEARRQDELRQASDKFNAAAIENAKSDFETGVNNIKEMVGLRAEYDERLRQAEKGRIDAIRLMDVNAVATASQKADTQANTLAKQVTDSAEALRRAAADSADKVAALVTTTASATQAAQQQQFTSVGTQITNLSARITALEQSGAGYAGKSEGVTATIAALGVGAGLVIGLLAIGVPLLLKRRNGYDSYAVPRGG